MRRTIVIIGVLVAACDNEPTATPDMIAHPQQQPTPQAPAPPVAVPPATPPPATPPLETPPPATPPPETTTPAEAPPPWPEMVLTPGRYAPEFAADYIAQVNTERRAFDAEMAAPKTPPRDANEAKHRVISEKGRRARLMNVPQLANMTDQQISDVLSYSPDMPSAPREFARLLEEHPNDVHVCVDHARWLQFRHEKENALAEYTRCGSLADADEEIRRYIHTQIAAVRQQR